MTADERAIRQLIETWLAASKSGDTPRVLSLMSDDVVFLMPGHPPMRGKSAFAASQDALGDVSIDATSDIEEIGISGDWAYAWTRLRIEMVPRGGGPPNVRSGHTLSVLKRVDGAWLLFRDANLLAPVNEKNDA
jgi:uncharacterized protein (TIGR02246 family)